MIEGCPGPGPPEGPPKGPSEGPPEGPPEGPTRARGAQVGGPTRGPSGWAHVGPKWVGPPWGPPMKKWGKFLKIFFTNEKIGGKFLKICFTHEKNGGRFGTPKIQKSKVLKIKIRSAQIVGEFFFYAGERRPRPIWGPPGQFFRRPENPKIAQILLLVVCACIT